ncbi:MAG: DNA-invertase hin [Pelotomaculum sp. PtaB.Bin104]|nr:MAG: DNA-invertase hin [Pelotomaculum sp. PtaB.Bin104]
MLTAAIYTRQSKDKKDSCSLEMQMERCIALCQANGWDWKVYSDPGRSGKDLYRPAFQKMMSDIKNQKINVVLVYRIDRISRNIRDFFNLMEEFKQLEIGFRSLTENFDTTTPLGRAMLGLVAIFAQLERETTAERVRDNMLDRAREGIWNGGPVNYGFGLKKSVTIVNNKEKNITALEPIQEQLENVERFFEWYLKPGGSVRRNVHKANSPPSIPTNNGKPWACNQMTRLLRNPIYCTADQDAYEYFSEIGVEIASDPSEFDGIRGLMWYNRRKPHGRASTKFRDVDEWILVIGNWPGTVPGKTFVAAQRKLDGNKEKPPRAATGKRGLLAWLLKCGHCGKSMTYAINKKSNKDDGYTYGYYRCRSRREMGKSVCHGGQIRGEVIESAVIEVLKKLCSDEKILNEALTAAKKELDKVWEPLFEEKKRLYAAIEEFSEEEQNLIKALGKSRIPINLIELRLEEISKEKEIYMEKLRLLEQRMDEENYTPVDVEIVSNNLKSFNKCFDALEFEDQRALIQSLIESVVYKDGEITINVYFVSNDIVRALSPHAQACGSKVQNISFQLVCRLEQDIDLSTTGKRLKQARLNKKLTIKKLADMVGVTEVTLGRWEKDLGQIENHPAKIQNLCRVLEIDVAYLFDEFNDNSFSSKLKKVRFEMGLSRREIAKILGVNRGTVLEWEQGKKPHKYKEIDILGKIKNESRG